MELHFDLRTPDETFHNFIDSKSTTNFIMNKNRNIRQGSPSIPWQLLTMFTSANIHSSFHPSSVSIFEPENSCACTEHRRRSFFSADCRHVKILGIRDISCSRLLSQPDALSSLPFKDKNGGGGGWWDRRPSAETGHTFWVSFFFFKIFVEEQSLVLHLLKESSYERCARVLLYFDLATMRGDRRHF